MTDDRTSLLGGARPSPPPGPTISSTAASSVASEAVFHDSSQSPRSRTFQILFVGLVVVMVLVTISLSISQGLKFGGPYFMLGVCLLGFAVLEILMIVFSRRGDLPKGKSWFLYFVGFCVMLEAIFTDVLLFQ